MTRHIGHPLSANTGGVQSMSANDSYPVILTHLQNLLHKREKSVHFLSNESSLFALANATNAIFQCIINSGKILFAGNGGSASQAQHFCAELMGRLKISRSPIQAISLCSDIAVITCIANDFGYERIFSRQIEGLGKANDIFIAFTTSGKSRNIIEALCECKEKGICSIVFCGKTNEEIKRFSNHIVEVPSEDTCIIQEVHLQFIHMACEIIEKNIKENEFSWEQVLNFGLHGYKHLILDRDGVINHVKANGYINSPEELIIRKDFLNSIKTLSDTFEHVFVVSNQKGVGKGIMTMEEMESVNKKMMETVSEHGGRIDNIYISTSAEDNAPDNKPNIGLATLIKTDFPNIDFKKCVVVGDSASDFMFAENLNCEFVYARTR